MEVCYLNIGFISSTITNCSKMFLLQLHLDWIHEGFLDYINALGFALLTVTHEIVSGSSRL